MSAIKKSEVRIYSFCFKWLYSLMNVPLQVLCPIAEKQH